MLFEQEMYDAMKMRNDGYTYHDGRWYFANCPDANIDLDSLIHVIKSRFHCDDEYAYRVAYSIKDYALYKKYLEDIMEDKSLWCLAMRELKFDNVARQWYAWGRPTDYKYANMRYPAYVLANIRYLSHTEGYRV